VQNQIKSNSGSYLLEIHVKKPFKIRGGRFAGCLLPAGYYYYAGSAQRNLSQRLSRHYKKDKILHWHIDHITVFKDNVITNCWTFEDAPKDMECRLTRRLIAGFGFKTLIKGFGSSDCRGCLSHLVQGGQTPLADFSF